MPGLGWSFRCDPLNYLSMIRVERVRDEYACGYKEQDEGCDCKSDNG